MEGITIKKKARPGAGAPPPIPPASTDGGYAIKKRSRDPAPVDSASRSSDNNKRSRPEDNHGQPPFRPPPPNGGPPRRDRWGSNDTGGSPPFRPPPPPAREYDRKPRWGSDNSSAAPPAPAPAPTHSTEEMTESYLALRSEASPRVLPAQFSVADEAAAFQLWLAVSKAEAFQALKPSESNRCHLEDCREEYHNLIHTLQKAGWMYDAQSRSYRQWSSKIDVKRAPFWFDFAPQRESASNGSDPLLNVAVAAPATAESTPALQDLRGVYILKIVSSLTQKFPETVSVLSSRLLRRYHGRRAAAAAVLVLPSNVATDADTAFTPAAHSESNQAVNGVRLSSVSTLCATEPSEDCPKGNLGRTVNTWMSAACGSKADLIVLVRGVGATSSDSSVADEISKKLDDLLLDDFVPVYPLFLSPEVLVLTPILLLQLNGCSNDAGNSLCVFQSLFSRIKCILGAYLHNPNSASSMDEVETSDYLAGEDDNWYKSGIRNEKESLDGRFHVMEIGGQSSTAGVAETCARFDIRKDASCGVDIASHVAWCQHGWCSVDTRVGLKTAVTHYKPKVILELGSWYGKSSRFMLDFLEPGTVLFCADYYKNNAIFEHKHVEMAGEDKMFFNFPRYENFVAGIESKRDDWKDKPPCTVITVKMNVHEIIPYLHGKGIEIDMVFIDAEKKTDPLYNLVTDIHRRYPSAVIVGDDNVFQSVKTCVRRLSGDGEVVISMDESYVVLPKHDQDRQLVTGIMWDHRKEIDVKNICNQYISSLFTALNENSLTALENFLFPSGLSSPMLFGDLAFMPDKDNGHSIAMLVISRAMKVIHKKNSPLIPKLTDLVLRILEQAPNAVMTEGRVTCFDFVARNIGFE